MHNDYVENGPAASLPARGGGGSAVAGRPARVFISSASGELAPYRKAAVEVCRRLGLTPVHMEDFAPERPPPAEVCQREVNSCDVLVLLLAHRYGSRPPGSELSYTELEYTWAMSRPGMSLIAFVVDPAFRWSPLDIDRGADADALARFTAHVRAHHEVGQLAEVLAFREALIFALKPHEIVTPPPATAARSGSGPEREARIPEPPAPHAVPSYAGGAPFTGRAGDLAVLDEWARTEDPVMVVEAIGGTGKSALTWQWTQDRAPEIIHGLAGQLWWSFYDGSASMTRFLREVLAYTSRRPMRDIRRLGRADLAAEVLTELRARPYLLVLDGFERLLAAYHRFDPSKVRDEDVEQDARSLIEPHAEDVVRALTAVRPSRILISTRLMPVALQGRFSRQVVSGVRHLRLPGLTDDDTCELLGRLDVQGSPAAIAGFFGPLGNHPLLVGVVAGLVRDYRADPGGFDRWLADPTAGGAFAVPDLDLTQRRSHILAAALAGLQPGHRQLLGWISVLAGAVSWITLDAINPFRPEKPAVAHDQPEDAAGPFEADLRARAQLDAALTDLEKRGLLWWDRFANSYDLHPVIRAYAHDELGATDRVRANERVRDHFEALPPEDVASATSVEDISQTITIFRALVGAGREREASWLWAEFGNVLLVHLGALTTVVELLSPLARTGERRVRSDLAIAYLELGRYDAAASQNTTLLADALRDEGVRYLDAHLASLCASFVGTGSPAAAGRYRDLWAALNAAIGAERDGDLYLDCAAAAGREGRVDKARELLDRAERLGSDKASPWFEGDIEYWRLYLALVADKSLTHGQLAEAAARGDSWGMRHELVNLRCRLFIQQGQLEQALAAAEEADQLGRNAGRVAAPAMTAFLLARLGRTDEASAAAEQALARLPRLHPADRPHYYLARAMHELGRAAESAEHARLAYGQAWADGPPYCYHWGLRDARDLLQALGEPIPDLPAASPRDVRVPLEAELRAFITKLASQRRR